MKKTNLLKIFLVVGAFMFLGPGLSLAQTYSNFNDCLSNVGTADPQNSCCNLSQFSSTSACTSGGSYGSNLTNGSSCITSPACASGNCVSGICQPAANGSGGSNPICDTANGYTMQNGLCIPKSPFSGGLASQSTLSGLITTILDIALTLSGVIAVIFIIIGGFQYMTARGNEEQAEKGRKALVNAIIGLLITILAFTIVTVVSNALTSSSVLTK